MKNLLDRITIDPQICHGKPVIRGLRYPVETLLELMSAGMTIDEILADYADLERQDLLAGARGELAQVGAVAADGPHPIDPMQLTSAVTALLLAR